MFKCDVMYDSGNSNTYDTVIMCITAILASFDKMLNMINNATTQITEFV